AGWGEGERGGGWRGRWKVGAASVDVKEKLGVVVFDGLPGAAVIDVFGAAVSTVHVKLAGDASVFPAGSVARALNVCEPSPSAESECGLVQGDHEPPSTRHSNVEPPSLEVKEKLG